MQMELFDVEAYQVANNRYIAMVSANCALDWLARGIAFEACFSRWF